MPRRIVTGGVTPCEPVLDMSVRDLCRRTYPGHPRWCPNYGRRVTCPPEAPLLGDVIDLGASVFCAWNAFPLGRHVERMRARHPEWSKRQLRCCLYWQGTARRQLSDRVRHWTTEQGITLWSIVKCPEACGVDVTATMASIGIALEWPPVNTAYQVALIGRRLRDA